MLDLAQASSPFAISKTLIAYRTHHIITPAFIKATPQATVISRMVNEVQSYGAPKKEDSYIVLLHDHVNKDDRFKWLSSIPNTLAGVTHDYNSRFLRHGFIGANSPCMAR